MDEAQNDAPQGAMARVHRFLDRYDWLILIALAGAYLLYSSSSTAPAVRAGEPAPAFSLQSLTGETHALADYRGRAVALTFWASWCGTCRNELPSLSDLSRELDPKSAAVVSLAVDSPPADVVAFASEARLAFPVLTAPREVSDTYGIRGLPTTLIVSPAGIVTDVFTGYTLPGAVARALRSASE